MNKDGLVSILIPVFNRQDMIGETIESALSQTYSNIEVIIVDNASTDGTWGKCQEFALKDKRVRIFRNDENIGPVRNWKRCIDEATGYYGKILWSDDLIASSFLEETVPYLKNNEDVGFVVTGVEKFLDGTDERSCEHFIGETGSYRMDEYIKGVLFASNYPVSPGCALFRLKDLERNILIDIPNNVGSDFSRHAIGNDLLIFLLTATQYNYFCFVNDKLAFFREHRGSITIQSVNGKLQLHYDLAKAYFVERYAPEKIKKLNGNLFIDLKRFSSSSMFGLNKVQDFYSLNRNYDIDWLFMLKRVLKKIFV